MPNVEISPIPTETTLDRDPVLHIFHRIDLGRFPTVISLCRTWKITGSKFETVPLGNVAPMDACAVCAELDTRPVRCPTCGMVIGGEN